MNKLHDEKYSAEFLDCSVSKLREMRRNKRGPRYIKVGRLVRYPEDWLVDFVLANAHPPEGKGNSKSASEGRGNV
jgi:hypothetical protein